MIQQRLRIFLTRHENQADVKFAILRAIAMKTRTVND